LRDRPLQIGAILYIGAMFGILAAAG